MKEVDKNHHPFVSSIESSDLRKHEGDMYSPETVTSGGTLRVVEVEESKFNENQEEVTSLRS